MARASCGDFQGADLWARGLAVRSEPRHAIQLVVPEAGTVTDSFLGRVGTRKTEPVGGRRPWKDRRIKIIMPWGHLVGLIRLKGLCQPLLTRIVYVKVVADGVPRVCQGLPSKNDRKRPHHGAGLVPQAFGTLPGALFSADQARELRRQTRSMG